MARSLLVRGMLVGLAAGVLAFAFAFAFGEPQVQKAIAVAQAIKGVQKVDSSALSSRG